MFLPELDDIFCAPSGFMTKLLSDQMACVFIVVNMNDSKVTVFGPSSGSKCISASKSFMEKCTTILR